jgi:hypothetical protein
MGLLAEYGSDSGSGSDTESAGPSVQAPPASTSKPQTKKRAAVKIGFDLKPLAVEDNDEEDRGAPDSSRKKPRLGDAGGKGKSALLDMLPQPKRALPASKRGPPTGGNGSVPASTNANPSGGEAINLQDDEMSNETPANILLPPSLRNKAGKGKAPVKAAELDFFGLGE